jgi:hypothetical protein
MSGEALVWEFADGEWAQVPDSLRWNVERQCWDGFRTAEEWGFVLPDVQIYEADGKDRWRVGISFDSCTVRTIEVSTLPDLIGLLALLAPIATAFLTSSVADSLQSLILDAGQAADRRHRRQAGR